MAICAEINGYDYSILRGKSDRLLGKYQGRFDENGRHYDARGRFIEQIRK
jgi:hypothetical protein